MLQPVLSLVIPTHNRRERLAATLTALASEEVPGPFEVIVIDDHSQDGTAEWLATHPFPTLAGCSRSNPGRGPAAARNAGIALAKADRVLLLGDDTRPAPGALAAHLRAAAGREIGVQGYIDWDPTIAVTAVMEFLAPAGPQFYFRGLEAGGPVPYTAILGANFSAPRKWFQEEPYDEAFPAAAFEDTELAFRFAQRGWVTIYAPDAGAWHHHSYPDLVPFLARQARAGRAARHAVRRHPRLLWRVVLQPSAVGLWIALRHSLRWLRRCPRQQDVWDLACRWAFLKGWLQG